MSKTIRMAGPLQSIPPLVSATAIAQDALPPTADTSDGYIGDPYGNCGRRIHYSNSKRF